ncbi:MAG: type I glyceraldehyde-3-phosphate dehydrogenase [Desulfomonilia bacterium]|jgi:glyceraldehyde 3-phosphate dehydrogenase|uniref:Glyceraldehyde-3-phosphate dehydrogenase n=1 Tax=anaerobic digester metagenome TaxID=1263854 RepID=A0A485M0J6_9ZZZZ|nr:type I glyceraldehyde-3-phosphate dehydrogenase [Pseudomonadota bacterium]HON37421.1 type I glyceraldehyde-3-phosphate dehydrogenase [Deltaproteobacteria bacterium]HPD20597.1 type I glyceraldehyde-3-phosphate dehydrogenase [Deltaproteobacteria bacterium]HRS55481.1 type I glyceraldehyde-3-phosphate dehydrogenase [Desulfomonilia bacterium]HRV35106.1 type I glyceraldehyde-3-phosphate dehydrogenase [Desulfomonilia bacterium]
MARVAINGMGRIGRALFKVLVDTPALQIVAVNDLAPVENIAYLLKYDSIYGRYGRPVTSREGAIVIDEKEYRFLQEKNPGDLPWKELEVDLVFECSGVFTTRKELENHLQAGASRVILSARAKGGGVETVVHGVNRPARESSIISTASCTTNCITPLVEVMSRRVGVMKAIMTTVHAYTSSQNLVDGGNKKWKRGRAAAINLVPTTTGAARATGDVLPEFAGRFDGVAVRSPIPVGSISDVVFLTKRRTSADEVNDIFREEARTERYSGVLRVAEDEIVSTDIIQDSHASIVDSHMTHVVDGDLVKVMSWYDNEWGYASQMARTAAAMFQ